MSPDSRGVENVLSKIRRELWVVTASDEDRRGGLVATWVSQASLDANPAIIVVSLATNHFTRELVDQSQGFSMHLLSKRHSDLALRFASSSGRTSDKFEGLQWSPGETGAPRLDDVLAWLDCRVVARLAAGDRVYYWSEVVNGDVVLDEPPLTDADWFPTLDPEQIAPIAADRDHDIQLQRPRFEAWIDNLAESLRPTNRDVE